jgi:hypothetical protein
MSGIARFIPDTASFSLNGHLLVATLSMPECLRIRKMTTINETTMTGSPNNKKVSRRSISSCARLLFVVSVESTSASSARFTAPHKTVMIQKNQGRLCIFMGKVFAGTLSSRPTLRACTSMDCTHNSTLDQDLVGQGTETVGYCNLSEIGLCLLQTDNHFQNCPPRPCVWWGLIWQFAQRRCRRRAAGSAQQGPPVRSGHFDWIVNACGPPSFYWYRAYSIARPDTNLRASLFASLFEPGPFCPFLLPFWPLLPFCSAFALLLL